MKLRDLLPFAFVAAPLLLGCDVDREFEGMEMDGMEMDGASETELPDGVEANDMILVIENEEGGRIHLWVDFTRDEDLVWGTVRATRWADDEDGVLWRPVGPTDEIGFLDPVNELGQLLTMDVTVPSETSYFDEPTALYLIFDVSVFTETLVCGTVGDESGTHVEGAEFVAWPVADVGTATPDVECAEL